MGIPVFHDDQHGTAIISAAAMLNGLELVGKKIGDVKVAVSGAGAAALACLDVMVGLGVQRQKRVHLRLQGRGVSMAALAAMTTPRRASRRPPSCARWPMR